MASRREQKERLRQERLAREQADTQLARQKRRRGMLVAAVLVLAAAAAVVAVVIAGSGGSGSEAQAAFGPHYSGLTERREAAGVPTMSEAATVGAAHFHPKLRIYVHGKQMKVPPNIGIDPANSPNDMAGLHTHDDSGTIHNEAGTAARLNQFFAIWGVPLSPTRLGPYRTDRKNRLRMWVDDKPSREFGNLQLKDGQQIVLSYGTKADDPI
jgi:hypothetical protein